MPLLSLLSKTEERKNDEDDDHETDEIDDVIHRLLLGVCQCLSIEHSMCQTPHADRRRALKGGSAKLFPLIFELPAQADSIARGGMVSSAPRGNGLGPRCRAHAEARQRSSCSSVHARAVGILRQRPKLPHVGPVKRCWAARSP